MYIYIYIYTHIYTCIYTYTYIYINRVNPIYICPYIYIHIYIYIYIYIRIGLSLHMYTHIDIYVHICICIHMYTCIYIYIIYICIHTHIYIYIHIYIQRDFRRHAPLAKGDALAVHISTYLCRYVFIYRKRGYIYTYIYRKYRHAPLVKDDALAVHILRQARDGVCFQHLWGHLDPRHLGVGDQRRNLPTERRGKLANRSKGHGPYARTKYGRTRASPTSFVTYHTHSRSQISKAAVMNDSKAILKCIISRKQKACSCTPSTTGAAYAASGAWRA